MVMFEIFILEIKIFDSLMKLHDLYLSGLPENKLEQQLQSACTSIIDQGYLIGCISLRTVACML